MKIERLNTESLRESCLPDGSRIVVDGSNEKVIALNATAGAAWEACSAPTTLEDMTAAMQRTVNPAVCEDLAAEAVRQLEEHNLVRTSGSDGISTRRAFLGKMGVAAALPVVAALTMTEQRAYAHSSGSALGGPRNPPPPPPPPPWWWPF